ncbi:hypothetical protein L198_07241 [Cryptococcus wingfieldii CBS 7118]|uniref:Uncharacterized protein n=1 Tax=Cryptococcus wingfieldii CBS 7118 TaxID=1295528 RepID=A0A1E3ID61_9TREE|nr:hypothetical protein L198_07241 [Cryptococcus wingfieldii CBS 7118]ODN86547.1 hypothetical protein L198_07241 [Cryptococcus wingfieldii CBS 7118]
MSILPLHHNNGAHQTRPQDQALPMEPLRPRDDLAIAFPAPSHAGRCTLCSSYSTALTQLASLPTTPKPILTTLTPLAPVHDHLLALLLKREYLGPSATMSLAPAIFDHAKYNLYRRVGMTTGLLVGLEKRKSRKRKLDCLRCVQELEIDTMEGMWALTNLHSHKRSHLSVPLLNTLPNVHTVYIHCRVLSGEYILERRWENGECDVEMLWGELKEGVMKQLGGGAQVVFYGTNDVDDEGRAIRKRKTFALPGRLLKAEGGEKLRYQRRKKVATLILSFTLIFSAIIVIATWGGVGYGMWEIAHKKKGQN